MDSLHVGTRQLNRSLDHLTGDRSLPF